MATEILSVPEDHLRDVIRVIRTGLEADDLGEIAPVVREQLTKWCDGEQAYIDRCDPLPTVPTWVVRASDGRSHFLVAAKTQAEVARLLGFKAHYVRRYGSITMNAMDVRRANAEPGVVWERPCGAGGQWHRTIVKVHSTPK